MKHYYAIKWTYGRATHSEDGSRIGNYYQFDSKAERDEFAANGADYTGESGYREEIKASDRELRRIKRSYSLRVESDGMLVF
jgi:hypothetical protein